MRRVIELWRGYWFRETPLIDLAVVRIILVTTQLWILIGRTLNPGRIVRSAELPDELYDPLPVLHFLIAPIDWTFRPPPELIQLVNAGTITSGVLALVGWFTNPALALFAVGSIFLQAHDYSYGDFHHPEAPLMIALVALALSPAGGVLSVDDLRRRARQSAKRLRFEAARLLQRTSRFAGWSLKLIQWILALVYLSAAYSKLRLGGAAWVNGYTLQYYLVEDGLRWGSDLSLWFAAQHEIVRLLSWATVLVEGTFLLAVLFPALRWIYLPAGAGMHVGVKLTLSAPFLRWIPLYSAFIPWSRALRRAAAWLHREPMEPARVYYDGVCPLCLRSVTVLDYLDWGNRLRFHDLAGLGGASEAERRGIGAEELAAEMHLIEPDGEVRRGFFAFRRIAARLPLLWPLALLARLPGAGRLGPHLYRFVARSRTRVTPCPDGACGVHVA